MPPKYLEIFLKDSPEPDAYLGEYEDAEAGEPAEAPPIDELREDPDVRAVLAAAALAA